ncbi:hypothetical protein AMECASPLE_036679 [Ameca splendens]|uniref:Uncharacterized protein n=1 Tax=Ameca splendens TaxID=208324 RepID=A0ABV0XKW0_9TELE
MSKEFKGKEHQPGRYVFNITQLPIQVREGTVCPNPPHPHCTTPARPGRQVELQIHSHPLYTSICTLSEVGLAYETYRQRRAIDGYNFAGPQIQPDYWLVYQWTWVWKGLEPGLPYPSPIYQTLLKGRVDRTEEADQLELAGYSRG